MEHFTARPELCGTFGAVASTHWIASAVGMRMLEKGGNAFDAAVAAGFVLQVVEPHLNGPGGDAPILATRIGDDAPTVICGQGPSPSAASLDRFSSLGLDLIPGTGLLAACIPGAYGAWMTLLRDFGTLPLRDVLEPAIHYALNGHPLLGRAADTIESVKTILETDWPTSGAVFLNQGNVPEAGSLFCNAALGRLYERVLLHAESQSGSRETRIDAALAYWYEGEVAEAVGRFFATNELLDVSGRHHGGLLTADDFSGWRPPIERPVSITSGEDEIFKCGPWSQGPAMLQALQILSGYDIAGLAPGSAEFVHLVTEAMKLAMADRDAWYGDDPDVPVKTLLSKTYGDERRNLITERASLELRPGAIKNGSVSLDRLREKAAGADRSGGAGGGEPTMAAERREPPADFDPAAYEKQRGDTCHVDVVDRWGNMVSATPSGGWLQSSPIIPELGFAMGTRLQMFWLQPGHANTLAPCKRPRTTLTPSMAYRGGKPYLAFGTPGGDQQEQWSLLLWLLHSGQKRPLQQSIEMPAFHTDHLIGSFWPREAKLGSLSVEGRFSAETIADLRRRGHDVRVGGNWSEGRLSACAFDRSGAGTMIRAGANPRGMQGYAIAR